MSANGSEYPIKLGNLQKAFGHQRVLNGLSLRVRRGETVAVLGRSGGGKSVLLKLIIGLQIPDAGSIQVAGKEITKLDENQLQDRKSTRLNSSHEWISYAVFCLKKKITSINMSNES